MGAVEKIKNSFFSGLVMIIPLLITLLIVKLLAGWAFILINPIVRSTNLASYTANIEIVAQLIAGIFVVSLLTLLGYMSNYRVSDRLRRNALKLVKDIPVFGTVYTTVQKISSTFSDGSDRFKEIVLVEFPREDVYSIGLVTSDSPDAMEDAVEKDLETVFIPMSPNPTMGNLIMVEDSDYVELDMSVQKGMKLLLTTGIAYEDEELPPELQEAKEDLDS
jgi:uncharacterized membrane protein